MRRSISGHVYIFPVMLYLYVNASAFLDVASVHTTESEDLPICERVVPDGIQCARSYAIACAAPSGTVTT